MKRELVSDIDRLRLAIDNWGLALVNEMQLLREAIVAINIDRKTENSSEKPNNSTISKMEQVDEPQPNADQHTQDVGSVESVEQTEAWREPFETMVERG